MDHPYPIIEIRNISPTNPPKKENANELDEEMSEIEPLKPGGMVETYCFLNPRERLG